MSLYDQFKEDLPEFVRGALPPERAQALLDAASKDMKLRRALEDERSLEEWLAYYEVPEMSPVFEARFWKNFHQTRVFENANRYGWRGIAAGIAACAVIAIGLLVVLRPGMPSAPTGPGTVAEREQIPPQDVEIDDLLAGWDELDYLTGSEEPLRRFQREPDAVTLALMKRLDSEAFAFLDGLKGEEALLDQDLALLRRLAESEDEE